jgi:hypothetical protein
MITNPPADAAPRRVQSFEFDSLLWWKKSGVWIVGTLGIVVFLMQPPYRGTSKKRDQTLAVSNARQIGLALFEFQSRYGSFPDPTTIAPLRKETSSARPLGTKTSNDFFQQLVVSGITQSEPMFYCKGQKSRKSDGLMDGRNLLSKGECGFTYMLGATVHDSPNRPLLGAPMIPGTDRFDPKPFDGKAVVLKLDCSVTSYPINKNGHVMIDGRNLMDTHHPIWDGHAPVIAWPDL